MYLSVYDTCMYILGKASLRGIEIFTEEIINKYIHKNKLSLVFLIILFFIHFIVQGRRQPTQSQLIQIYSVDWTDVYDTYNIGYRTEPVSH